ncbi:hypothetical protein F3Y22_tig00111837pilonHSYRG00692 [Hibiscus syriacus]|uniref:DUF4283 domain-containing protein n=1 Tax=Hibiscus syriacus TaxID=106335 RepID=A0A6A2XAR2_HIBSY|nr:hypothetical protein F3Y22_tig00111837pilonHSYRG00692 [Hibiscus syriacus]
MINYLDTKEAPTPLSHPDVISDATKKVRFKDPASNLLEDAEMMEQNPRCDARRASPLLRVSTRAYKLMEASMTRMAVLKLLGRNIGLNALTNKTYAIWKPSRPFTLMDIENGYFLARFQNEADYEKDLATLRMAAPRLSDASGKSPARFGVTFANGILY